MWVDFTHCFLRKELDKNQLKSFLLDGLWWFIGCLATNWPWPRCLTFIRWRFLPHPSIRRRIEVYRQWTNKTERDMHAILTCLILCCWWFRNPANQLRLVASTNYLQGLIDLRWCRIFAINSYGNGHGGMVMGSQPLKLWKAKISDWKIQKWWCLNWKEWVWDLFLGVFSVFVYQPVRYHLQPDMGLQICGRRLEYIDSTGSSFHTWDVNGVENLEPNRHSGAGDQENEIQMCLPQHVKSRGQRINFYWFLTSKLPIDCIINGQVCNFCGFAIKVGCLVEVRDRRNNGQRELPVTRWWFQLGEYLCLYHGLVASWCFFLWMESIVQYFGIRLMLICKYHELCWCNAFLVKWSFWGLGWHHQLVPSYHDVRLLLAKQILHVRTVFFVVSKM